jgi:SM-20-related protein
MILTIEGIVVFFKSSELEDEVLLTNIRRMSITGWLNVG